MKKLLFAVLVIVGLASCDGTKSFKINVNLENSNGKTVYLQRYEGDALKTLDSIVVEENKAVFKVKESENTDPFIITMKGIKGTFTVFADNQDVNVTGDCQNLAEVTIKASESQEQIDALNTQVGNCANEEDIYYTVMSFVKENPDNAAGFYALYRYKWAFTYADLKNLLSLFPENKPSAYKQMAFDYCNKIEQTEPGHSFIDFTLPDVNGEDFTMSSVVGSSKIIILDFWASWCPDCRKANPELVALYNKYKDKGLDIVSVSLDENKDKWIKAIDDDNLSWKHHVSDLNRWKNNAAELYSIAFIPQSLVIDENGIILEKNLPFEKLEDLLANRLK